MEILEFAAPALNVKAILPQLVMTLTALTVLLIDVFSGKDDRSYLGWISLVGVCLSIVCVLFTAGLRESAYSGMFMADGFSTFITLTVCVVTLLTILISISYQNFCPRINCGEYYSLVLFAAVGMSFMGAAGNLLMVFVALETMSIAVYALAGFQKDEVKSTESALKYFLLGAFASAFLLYGFALIYGATGTMDIIKIGRFISDHPQVLRSQLLMGGIALMTVGFGFKVAMVPFHMWTPDVYEGAPTSITAFMATGVKAASFAAFVRVFFVAIAQLNVDWVPIMWVIAALTMTIGNVIALSQSNIKRMLAYSSIAHAGYLLIGFVAYSKIAVAGILFYLMGYAFMNLGAFGVIALFCRKEGGEYNDLDDFKGLGFKYPAMGLAMGIFMFSLAGIPPTAGFMGKFYIFTAAIKSGFIWLAVIGVINSVISVYYYLRVLIVMYFQEQEQDVAMPSPSPAIIIALILACSGVLFMGVLPSLFWELARQSNILLM